MKITKKDLLPRNIQSEGTKRLLVPNEEGKFEEKDCPIVSFGLSHVQVTLSMTCDTIQTDCPTASVTDCTTKIEFDAGEMEDLFKTCEAFQTACPGCKRPLGLILSKRFERSFFFGWLP